METPPEKKTSDELSNLKYLRPRRPHLRPQVSPEFRDAMEKMANQGKTEWMAVTVSKDQWDRLVQLALLGHKALQVLRVARVLLLLLCSSALITGLLYILRDFRK